MTSFRVACRSLARRPGFTFIATLTLAVGIAATTTVFSVVDTVLLKGLPFQDPERLVTVMETNPARSQSVSLIAPGRLEDWSRAATTFTASAIRAIVRQVAPGRAIFGMRPLEQALAASLDQPRLNASALTIFAGAAMTLASLGLYSLLTLLVSERARVWGFVWRSARPHARSSGWSLAEPHASWQAGSPQG